MGNRVIKKKDSNFESSKSFLENDHLIDELTVLGKNKIIKEKKAHAYDEAKSIRYKARIESENVIEDSKNEAQEILLKAEKDGKEILLKAEKDGEEKGQEHIASELSQMVLQTSLKLQKIEEQIFPQLKRMALKIAQKIIGYEITTNPDVISDIVKTALLEKAQYRRTISLRVNPKDLEIIQKAKPKLLESLAHCKEIHIREDSTVQRYGCIIETDTGTIDAQIKSQLKVFQSVLDIKD